MITINLKFNKIITSLAGNEYGRSEFKNQIKNVDYENEYEIIFPDQIVMIATSFIQGFFSEFVEQIGLEGIKDRVQIKSLIPNLKQYILDCLV